MVAATVERFGRLDILVNNAGIGIIQPLMEVGEADWNRVMAVNAKGVLLCSQAAARRMIARGAGGRIINIASAAGKMAISKDAPMGAYGASKHALVGLTRQLGLELAGERILVNCICPGVVDNEAWWMLFRELVQKKYGRVGLMLQWLVKSLMLRKVADIVPLGRFAQEEEVAAMVAFLASPDSSYSTGQAFNMSGGQLQY